LLIQSRWLSGRRRSSTNQERIREEGSEGAGKGVGVGEGGGGIEKQRPAGWCRELAEGLVNKILVGLVRNENVDRAPLVPVPDNPPLAVHEGTWADLGMAEAFDRSLRTSVNPWLCPSRTKL
jgi:hypothetical protein